MRRLLSILAVLASLASAAGCTKTTGPGSETPTLSAPATIADLDDYAAASNAYALRELDDPGREAARAQLVAYLIGYVDHALERGQLDAAIEGLEQAAGLWVAVELRRASPSPELAALAKRVYLEVAASGDERPALLALGLMQAFGAGDLREHAERDFSQITDWLQRTEEFADDPRVAVALDHLLEDVTAHLPTPFLVDALAATYLERYRTAQRQGNSFGSGDPRIPFTGYLLARLYLRADDPEAAVVALDRIPGDASIADLRALIAEVADAEVTAESLDQLIFEFLPTPDDRLPPEIIVQSWGIVDNLARRSLARFPDHAPAHLARGRVLRSRNHVEAAIVHYERAFAAKTRPTSRDDLFLAWTELAELLQLALEAQGEAGGDVDEALARVERFHVRAAETWPQRPIEPGVSLAWMTVAVAEFDAGHIARAKQLMEQTIGVDPQPAALSLLATIALRSDDYDEARSQLGRLASIADRLPDQLDRYDWQIDAKLGLAEVELLAGNGEAGRTALREALRQLNTLLSYPGLSASLRAEFCLRRAKVFFLLGEIELAMADAREAQQLAPERSDAFADPLIFTTVHGHYDEALQLLDAALDHEAMAELGVYFSLWVEDLAQRLGQPMPKRARTHLRSVADDDGAPAWTRKLARHGLGELDDAALTKAAQDPRQRSEAFFYAGLARWRAGEHKAGLALLRDVIEQQMMGDFEYQMAQSYLRWSEVPKTARAALTPSNE